MKGGRKNLKRAAEEQSLTVQDGQSVMQVVSLRGSNLIEVMDAQGEKSLALFPAKFQKSMWIKRGSFVVVDESGKEKALKDGSKVACIVTKVLFYGQVRSLQKSSEWPEIFKSTNANDSNETLDSQTSQPEENNESDLVDDDDEEEEDEDDDGLPPLEANTNRINPFEWHSEPDSGSDTDTDSCTKRTQKTNKKMAISVIRVPLFYHPQLPVARNVSGGLRKVKYRSKRFTLLAQYSQTQDLFSSRLQNSIENLPKLVEDIVQTSINTGPRGALRLAQGIQAFVGVGGEWLADVSKSTSSSSTGLPTQLQLGLLSPLYLRRLFERMGATYIKLGQFIASAPTLFPQEYVSEFQNCFDRAPAVPFEEIKTILREDLGKPIESVYEYVDPTPLASASIAQVHGARLRGSQEDVVIKVLKPGIEDVLMADLNFVYVVARILEFLNPELSRTSLVGIVKDIRESMLEEVDFKKEAANIESFRRYLEIMGLERQATAPKVYHHCSTRRVLTMERLYGVPLTDLDSISSFVSSPETSLITALNVWFGSLLGCETFHADVHAGNLWVLRDGRIGFLDFGIVGRISPKTWAAMDVFLASIATEEYEPMASSLIAMGATDKDVDVKAFARDLEKIFSSIQASTFNFTILSFYELDTEIVVATARGADTNATAVSANVIVDERQMNALFLDVIRVSESYGLRFPREFALLMKQLLYFDRYTRLLAPEMNMLQDQRISIVSNRRSNYRDSFR
ncbi:hypothetical protein EZV62_025833 [Acer yangbiense]|uniref:S1-like domain-containing protein n=1 Tax=Acer yangbiense TaxID=1000413 RepID=A0A5C7GYX3_9ROSI|nr:hypothetical protein EZV62_025833 [Acer yangbiense]